MTTRSSPEAPLRIGLVGPSRRRNGTGPFVARFLTDAGARVVAVSASTFESSAEAAGALQRRLGHDVMPFPSVEAMTAEADLDAVAICSPTEYHAEHLELALGAGVHVFCEKPLLWSGTVGDAARARDLLRRFARMGLVVHHNTQWRFVLDDVKGMLGERAVLATKTLEVSLAPAISGPPMLPEATPHAISLMVALGATGDLEDASARWSIGQTRLELSAVAVRRDRDPLATRVLLATRLMQPRPASLVLDGRRIDRIVTSLDPYRLALLLDGRTTPIADPAARSAGAFLERVRAGAGGAHEADILTEIRILEQLGRVATQATEPPQP